MSLPRNLAELPPRERVVSAQQYRDGYFERRGGLLDGVTYPRQYQALRWLGPDDDNLVVVANPDYAAAILNMLADARQINDSERAAQAQELWDEYVARR